MKKNLGIALIEVIIGSAIISVGILTINSSFNTYVEYALANQRNAEAAYILEEGLEAMTFIRDKGWNTYVATLSTTTTQYLSFYGGTWSTVATPEYVDGVFLRSIAIEDVTRDGTDDISAEGTYDPDIKKITSTVSYFQGKATTTKSMSVYIANIYK